MTSMNRLTIPPLDDAAQEQARQRQMTRVKPLGALGQLETLSIRLCGMTGQMGWRPQQRLVMVCAGDHGIVSQGVSTVPSDVTAYMVRHFLNGTGAINVLSRQMQARLVVIDAGMTAYLDDHPLLIQGKIRQGTADFSTGPAMSETEAEQAVSLGYEAAVSEIQKGVDLIAIGEMGIGNTSAASAIIAAITGYPVREVTGRGTGIRDEQLARKIALIERALEIHAPASVNTLAKVGGLEIGAMAGIMLAAAAHRVPAVIDGLICTAAALIAAQLQPAVKDYLIAGHLSPEPGHQIALNSLGLAPLLKLDMRLGEGTGAVLAFPIIEAAMLTLQEMATLELNI
jgi:nicotinate-nucleotide--dimethylbenzimidazole phosphoribosyltransferase